VICQATYFTNFGKQKTLCDLTIVFWGAEFSPFWLKKKLSAIHTTYFCERNVPKLPDFEGKKIKF